MNKENSEKKVKLSRIARIDDELRSGRCPNSEELALKMEVSQRTILRDIEYLKDFYNAPIEYDYTKRGFYYTEPNFFIKSVILTEEEFKVITIYDDIIKKMYNDEDELNLKFRKVVGKILAVIPENITKDLAYIPSSDDENDSSFEPTDKIDDEIFFALNEAIEKQEIIEVEFIGINEKEYSLRTLKPLCIDIENRHCDLIAFSKENPRKPGVYSISNMKNFRNTKKTFKIPSKLKIPDYFVAETKLSSGENKTYLFELSFHKDIASEALNRIYYHNQTIEQRKDGTVHVKFKTSQLQEVFRWVLGQGYKVKVLNPPELVSMMKTEMSKVRQYYL